MSDPGTMTLTVRYVNGTEDVFEIEPQGEQELALSRTARLLESNYLILEVEGKLLMVPTQSVLSIEVSPAPAKIPEIAIRGARYKD